MEAIQIKFLVQSNISSLVGDLGKVQTALQGVNSQLAGLSKLEGQIGSSQFATMKKEIEDQTRAYHKAISATHVWSSEIVTLTSNADRLADSINKQRMPLGQVVSTLRNWRKEAGAVQQLARKQVRLEQSHIQYLGESATGMKQASVATAAALDLENKYAVGMSKASKSAQVFTGRQMVAMKAQQVFNSVVKIGTTGLINLGKNTQWAGRQMMVGLTIPVVIGAGMITRAFKEIDEQLVRLQKVYGSGFSFGDDFVENGKKIRKTALELSKELASTWGQSAKDTINLMAELAATGLEDPALTAATKQTTRLAILGEVEKQDAIKTTIALQTAFKQNTKELTESIDFLNAVENQTSTSLQDLSEAIPRAGAVVSSLGGSIKDLSLYMTAMIEGGISAPQAANALKSGLISIINPSTKAAENLKAVGINIDEIVERNAGQLTPTIKELSAAFKTLDDLTRTRLMTQLFGKYQGNRMLALFENLDAIGSQTLKVQEIMAMSSETLARVSEQELSAITESATGKFKRMTETIKASLAPMGEFILNVWTKVGNALIKLLDFLNNMPDVVKVIGAIGLGFAAIVGPVVMLLGIMMNFVGTVAKGLLMLKEFVGHLTTMASGGRWSDYKNEVSLFNKELWASDQLTEQLEESTKDVGVAWAIAREQLAKYESKLLDIYNKYGLGGPGTGAGGGYMPPVTPGGPYRPIPGIPIAGLTPNQFVGQEDIGQRGAMYKLQKDAGGNPRVREYPPSEKRLRLNLGLDDKKIELDKRSELGYVLSLLMAAMRPGGGGITGGLDTVSGRATLLPKALSGAVADKMQADDKVSREAFQKAYQEKYPKSEPQQLARYREYHGGHISDETSGIMSRLWSLIPQSAASNKTSTGQSQIKMGDIGMGLSPDERKRVQTTVRFFIPALLAATESTDALANLTNEALGQMSAKGVIDKEYSENGIEYNKLTKKQAEVLRKRIKTELELLTAQAQAGNPLAKQLLSEMQMFKGIQTPEQFQAKMLELSRSIDFADDELLDMTAAMAPVTNEMRQMAQGLDKAETELRKAFKGKDPIYGRFGDAKLIGNIKNGKYNVAGAYNLQTGEAIVGDALRLLREQVAAEQQKTKNSATQLQIEQKISALKQKELTLEQKQAAEDAKQLALETKSTMQEGMQTGLQAAGGFNLGKRGLGGSIGMALSSAMMLMPTGGEGGGKTDTMLNIAGATAMGASVGTMIPLPYAQAVGAAVGAVVASFKELKKASDKFRESIAKAADAMGSGADKFTPSVIESFGGKPIKNFTITLDPELGKQVQSVSEQFSKDVASGFTAQIESLKVVSKDQALDLGTQIYSNLLLNGIPAETAAKIVQEILRQAGQQSVVIDVTARFKDFTGLDAKGLAEQAQGLSTQITAKLIDDLDWDPRVLIEQLWGKQNKTEFDAEFRSIGDQIGGSLVAGINGGLYNGIDGELDTDKLVEVMDTQLDILIKSVSAKMNVSMQNIYDTLRGDDLKTVTNLIDPDSVSNIQDLTRAFLLLDESGRGDFITALRNGGMALEAEYFEGITIASDGWGNSLGKVDKNLQSVIDKYRALGYTVYKATQLAITSAGTLLAGQSGTFAAEVERLRGVLDEQSSSATDQKAADVDALREKEDAALDAMRDAADARQEAMQDEIDAVKERYDAEIEKIKAAADAKEKAMDREEELARRAAELRNDQISYQEAIARGDLFAAARIKNDMEMKRQQNITEDEKDALKDATDRRVKKLEDERDKKVKAMEDALEAQKKADEAAIESAQKASEARIKAAEKAATASVNAQQKALTAQKKALDDYQTKVNEILEDTSLTWAQKMDKIYDLAVPAGFNIAAALTDPIYDEIRTEFPKLPAQMFDIIKKFVAKQDWGVVGRIISAANFLDESSFQQFLSLLDKGQPVQVTPNRQLLTQTPQTGNRWIPIGGYAKGGPVDGPGSETSDSIPARLSNGEYVVSAKGVRQAGISTLNAINSGIGGVADVMFRQAIASGIASAVLKGRESAGSDFGPGGYGSPASESGNWAYPFAKKYPITSHYGARRGSRRHTGTDIGAPYGTPILAVNYGKVGYVGVDPSKASASQSFSGKVVPWMGNMVSVGHSGTVSSAYGHMSRFAPIEAGSTVRRGQILGYVGSTGNSTGPHLHLGMRNKNGRLNPEAIIPGLKNGAVIKYDNTLANLHRGESVLTAPLTRQMQDIASGAKIEYNVNVNVANANATPDDIDQAVYGALRRHELKMGYGRKIGR